MARVEVTVIRDTADNQSASKTAFLKQEAGETDAQFAKRVQAEVKAALSETAEATEDE